MKSRLISGIFLLDSIWFFLTTVQIFLQNGQFVCGKPEKFSKIKILKRKKMISKKINE